MSTQFERDIIEYQRRTGDRLDVGAAFNPTDPSTYKEAGRQLGDAFKQTGQSIWNRGDDALANWNPIPRKVTPEPEAPGADTGEQTGDAALGYLYLAGGILGVGLVGYFAYRMTR
jgi:hypothetical protein